MILPRSAERTIMVAVVVNTTLGMALGMLIAGVRGAAIGWLVGVGLALLPWAARLVARTVRPQGLVRFVAREIGMSMVAASASFARTISYVLKPVARALRGPLLIARFLACGIGAVILQALGRSARLFAPPLGPANVVALLVIAANLVGLEGASIALFASLPAMILVLVVAESESL